jgi:hypothetical protein
MCLICYTIYKFGTTQAKHLIFWGSMNISEFVIIVLFLVDREYSKRKQRAAFLCGRN